MAIIRIQIDNNFTIVPNELINDPNLDWRDVGLLTFLISKVDEWQVNTEHLMSIKKSKRDAIHASFKSIIAAGYMKRKPNRDSSGKMKGWIYDLSNKPIFLNESPNTEKPDSYKERNINNTESKQELTYNNVVVSHEENLNFTPEQQACFEWAKTQSYWLSATATWEGFLQVYAKPSKRGMKAQFEASKLVGGGNATLMMDL